MAPPHPYARTREDFVAPSVRHAFDAVKGRHLVAAAPIPRRRLVFCERPVVASPTNGVVTCRFCFAFCGTPRAALEATAAAGTTPAEAAFTCSRGCGYPYCGEECRADDLRWGGHAELCTGRVTSDDHPLPDFKRHAMRTNAAFPLAAAWIARLRRRWPGGRRALSDFRMEPWWEVACLPYRDQPTGFAESERLETSLRCLCEESCDLLKRAWGEHSNDDDDDDDDEWLSPLGMAKLIGSIEQNCMGIRRKQALRQNIMEDQTLREQCHDLLIRCLERAGMIGDGQDDCEDDCCGPETVEEDEENDNKPQSLRLEESSPQGEKNVESTMQSDMTGDSSKQDDRPEESSPKPDTDDEHDYSPDEIAKFLANLPPPTVFGADDEWDELFVPLDGMAMYATACKCNHSCEPNMVLLYRTNGWGRRHPLAAYCVALRDIEEGEEITISYIDADQSYRDRQRELVNYGFACACPKCEREKLAASSEEQEDGDGDSSDDSDDLFGSDSDDDGGAERGEEQSVDGATQLANLVERLETASNAMTMAAIPMSILAPAASYAVRLMATLTEDVNIPGDETNVVELVRRCKRGVADRDFSLCRVVGQDLERILFRHLLSNGSWTHPSQRRAYWAACIAATIGYGHEGSFWVAMNALDGASILGLNRADVAELFLYIEIHSLQLASAPCPPAIDCRLPAYADDPELMERIYTVGLSRPIRHPVEESSASDFASSGMDSLKSRSEPLLITKFAKDWKCIVKWRDLMTLVRWHGYRLVPVEVGSIDVSESAGGGMTERIMSIREFVSSFMVPSSHRPCWSLEDAVASDEKFPIGYMAQHSLLDQIPMLYGNDDDGVDDLPRRLFPDAPPLRVNVWMGTGGTRTPLHFDSYDNVLVQIVGVKYVRLYAPDAVEGVRRRDGHARRGNMSDVDCEREASRRPYAEAILWPGDALYIPARHWHYVRSIATGISVNYWF